MPVFRIETKIGRGTKTEHSRFIWVEPRDASSARTCSLSRRPSHGPQCGLQQDGTHMCTHTIAAHTHTHTSLTCRKARDNPVRREFVLPDYVDNYTGYVREGQTLQNEQVLVDCVAVFCVLYVVCCLLSVACCLLSVVCCLFYCVCVCCVVCVEFTLCKIASMRPPC